MSLRVATFAVALLTAGAAEAQSLAIVHGRLHTMTTAGVVEDGVILIEGGVIRAVGAGLPVPTGARVIDAHGQIVTPGLFDPANRLGLAEASAEKEPNDSAASESGIGPAFEAAYGINPNSHEIADTRLEGATRSVVAPLRGKSAFAGVSALIDLGRGPDIVVTRRASLNIILGEAGADMAGGARSAVWAQVNAAFDDAALVARNAAPIGSELHRLSTYDLKALNQALAEKLPIVFSVDRESDIREVVRFAQARKLKVVIKGGAEAWRAADLLAKAGIPVIVHPAENMPARFESIGSTSENAARLHKAGVKIAISDAALDYAPLLTQLAGLAVAHGLPWQAAMEALTINPAQIWNQADRYGTLAAGKDADVVIWDGDPLEVTTAPVAVVIRGEAYPMTSRRTALRDRYLKSGPLPPAYR